jgi:hypothetical protein
LDGTFAGPNRWTGNGGLRYQFTPETIAAAVMPTKAPARAAGTVIPPTYWTGFYVGGSPRGQNLRNF